MLTRFKPRRKTTSNDKVSLQTKSFFGVNKGIDLLNPPIELEDMYLRWANNVLVEEGKIKKRNGYIKFGTQVPLAGDPVLNITQFLKYDGSEYLCAFTTKNAYKYNISTKRFDLITENEVVEDGEIAWTNNVGCISTADASIFSDAVAESLGDELVTNTDFGVSGVTGWTAVDFNPFQAASGGEEGTTCAECTKSGGSTQFIYQDIATVIGAEYKFYAYAKQGTAGVHQWRIRAGETDYSNTTASSPAITSAGWTFILLSFTATATTTRIVIEKLGTDAGTVFFDTVSVRKVLATGLKSSKNVIADGTTGVVSYRNFPAKVLTGYTHLYFYVRSSKVLASGDIRILLDNTKNCASPLETLNIPAVPVADKWYEFCVELNSPSSLGAIVSIGLSVPADLDGVTVYIDNIFAVNCFTGTVKDKIITEQIYDDTAGETKFIFTNGTDNIKFWNGTGNWANLAGTPNKAKRLINFEHYLMLLYTYVGSAWAPQRIEWPIIGKPTLWTGSGSGNSSLAGNAFFIEGAEHSRSGLEVYKKKSISTVTFQGGVDPFVFEENKIKNCGLLAVGSLQNLGETRIFLGEDDVYIYDSFTTKPVGNKIVKRLIDELNPDKLDLIHSHIIKHLNLYLLFVPSTNSDYCDFCWVYNYIDDTWNFWKFADSIMATGYYKTSGTFTIGDLTQKIGNLKFTLGSKLIQNLTDFSLLGSSDGFIYKYDYTSFSDDGEAIDGYIDTKSYVFGGINLFSMLCQISLFGKGGDITVYVSVDDGVNFTTIGTIDQNTTTELAAFLRKVDQIGDRFMVRFRNNTVDEWFEITGWELEYIEKTRVVK